MNDWEAGVIVPVQIREDHWVRIGRIPHDLSKAEAERISRVVMSYAQAIEAGTATTAGRGPKDESAAPATSGDAS